MNASDTDWSRRAETAGEAREACGTVKITSEMADRIADAIDTRLAAIDERFPKLVDECPYETKLAVAAWVMKGIVENARDGGSFRRLIYGRLNFGSDAYLPLYHAEGQTITNELRLESEDRADPDFHFGD